MASGRRLQFEVVQQRDGQWFPRIRAGNGEIWFVAESSKRKATARQRLLRFMTEIGVVLALNLVVEVPKAKKETK